MESNNQNNVVSKIMEKTDSLSFMFTQDESKRQYRNFELNLLESFLPIVWLIGNIIILISYITALVMYIKSLYSMHYFSMGYFLFLTLCLLITAFFWRIILEFISTQFTQVKLLREIRDHLKKQE